MTIALTKHHGLGNDFLVVFHPGVDDLAGLAGGCVIAGAVSVPTVC